MNETPAPPKPIPSEYPPSYTALGYDPKPKRSVVPPPQPLMEPGWMSNVPERKPKPIASDWISEPDPLPRVIEYWNVPDTAKWYLIGLLGTVAGIIAWILQA